MKSMNGMVFVIFLMAILLMPSVIAPPPFSVQAGGEVFTKGLEIRFPPVRIVQVGRNVTANFHVFNISDGLPMTSETVSCYFHLYNKTGGHKIDNQIREFDHLFDFEIFIDGKNFSEAGILPAMIQCNSSTIGGFASFSVEITRDGNPTDVGEWNIAVIIGIIGIAFLFIMLSSVFAREQKGIKTLLVMLALGCIVLVAGYIILITGTGNPIDFSSYSLLNTALLTITIIVFWIFIVYYFIIYLKETLRLLKESREGVTD